MLNASRTASWSGAYQKGLATAFFFRPMASRSFAPGESRARNERIRDRNTETYG